ncbi:MAG: nitrous oxide-stimulated promoter family protein [Spirochaetes bacterium]|jgi:hypothetical protein|nr:nitrous oxide-stimulated promoter family protein [Spirochaetota bacterium]
MNDSAINPKIQNDIDLLANFISIFCGCNHRERKKSEIKAPGKLSYYLKNNDDIICDECRRLLLHSASKRLSCPYDPKPRCKKCETHCYGTGYREKIREVMRFSGKYLIKHGKIGLILKYLF